jgi:cytochrome c oxidase assembly factor CtaG
MLTAAHMVEHSILSGIVAPAIVLAWRALPLPPLRARHPLAAWAAFVIAQWVFHLTPLLAESEGIPVLHTAEHLAFVAIGVWFWIPILAVGERALGDPARSLYLVGAVPAIDLVGVMLMSRGEQAAGVAMIAGGMPIVVAAVAVTWSWMAREQREAKALEARHVAAG